MSLCVCVNVCVRVCASVSIVFFGFHGGEQVSFGSVRCFSKTNSLFFFFFELLVLRGKYNVLTSDLNIAKKSYSLESQKKKKKRG